MTPESSAKLPALFDRAISGGPEIRSALLAEVSATDPELARELASLLSAHDTADDFFEMLSRDVIAPAVSAVGLAEAKSDPALLRRLNAALAPAYRIESELGGGGMSRVFVATEERFARKVVIKVLPPEMSLGVSVERFRREIQLSARLQHPHIVHVLASDAADDLLYYVMPYVEGETLRARVSRDGPLPLADALAIWRDVLDALGFAHQHGVVHRDVKPENILLSGRNALVADFGIARAIEAAAEEGDVKDKDVTAQGVALGTPSYMAPEQASGEGNADQRVDIYAAGLVMYEMLAGRSPFAGLSKRETVLAHLTQTPQPITRTDVPADIAALVLRCLEKNPEARPSSTEAILQQLEGAAAGGSPRMSRRRKYASIAAVILLASILVSGAGYVVRQGVSSPSAGGLATPGSSDARPSLAVLPLTNRSADPADAELADGMTEELIGTLSRNPDLRVIASTSAFALKGTQRDVRQIAESLHVSNILEGSLQKIGPRLRMQVRLIGTGDGSTKWSEVYDREMNDLFAVQEEIARAVAGELDVQLRKSGQAGPKARRYNPNVVAYESYVRGMDVALMRTSAGSRRAMAHFERAIAADSNFAAAHAGLVRTYLQIGNTTGLRDRRAWVARAETAALKAVALDDSLAEAHAALGWVLVVQGDYSNGEVEFKKAIALNASAPRVHEGLARLYMMTSRPAEQLVQARRGMESDPFSHSAIREMALALNMNDRCDEALELLKPLKSLSPPAGVAWIISGQCYASLQKWPEAVAEYRWNINNATGASGPAFLAHALARAGRAEEARRILSDLLAGRKDSHGAFGVGVVYAGLRDYDQAFRWLSRAADDGSITAYIALPMFADLHRDPRYGALRQRMRYQKR
jgi:serine/threonine protein kinase/tetratricopeptide (TPR) repeat protein